MAYYKKDQDRINSFSKWLRVIASKKGFDSQRQLAIKSGVNEATISRIWNATQLPDEVTVGKLAKALEIDLPIVMWEAGYITDYDHDNRETAKGFLSDIVSNPGKYSDIEIANAYEKVLIGYFFRSVQRTPIEIQHPSQRDYIAMLLYNPHMKDKRLTDGAWKLLVEKYGTKPGIDNGFTEWYTHKLDIKGKNLPSSHTSPALDEIMDNLQQMSQEDIENFRRLTRSVVNRKTEGVS